MKAIAAMSRRIAEALWWVQVRGAPYRYLNWEAPRAGCEVVQMGNYLVSAETGEVLKPSAENEAGVR